MRRLLKGSATLAAAALCLPWAAGVHAAPLDRSHWLVLAETGDIDSAIGVALAHRMSFESVGVTSDDGDGFTAIAGPFAPAASVTRSAGPELLARLPDGGRLLDLRQLGPWAWQRSPEDVEDRVFRAGDELRIAGTEFDIALSTRLDPFDHVPKPVLTIRQQGGVVHETVLDESGTDAARAQLRVTWLDRAADAPQIMFSAYTMGARCCTVTTILTRNDGAWDEVDGGWHEGSEGFRLEDADGDGQHELVSYDERFIGTFAPSATSWMPVRVHRLIAGTLVDVTHIPAYAAHHRRALASLEHLAELEPKLWNEAGYLAAWAALKSIAGERDDAWSRVSASRPPEGSRSYAVCRTELNHGVCPEGQLARGPFAEVLPIFLTRTGYW